MATPIPASIAGGFVLIPVASLLGAWRACQVRPLGAGCFRSWLACWEMRERRRRLGEGRVPAFGFPELAKLLGISEKRAKASVNLLVAAGLLDWSGRAIGFPEGPSSGPGQITRGVDPQVFDAKPGHFRDVPQTAFDTIGGGRGSVAIPRRMLRMLAGGARPALIATSLGILLRCLSRRRGGWDGRGRVKASWIAGVFGIDVRRVKAARLELVALGWIAIEPANAWAERRWGRAYRVDLGWGRGCDPQGRSKAAATAATVHTTSRADGRQLPPRTAGGGYELPPPDIQTLIPSRDGRNQEPARPGVKNGLETGGGRSQVPLPSPDLDDVRPDDLRDVGRLLLLFDQAVGRQIIKPSEANQLRFVTAAEHARAIGSINPPGLFARIVRAGLWRFLTQDDEDSARRRLRDYLHRPAISPVMGPRPKLCAPDRPDPGPSPLGDVLGSLMGRLVNDHQESRAPAESPPAGRPGLARHRRE